MRMRSVCTAVLTFLVAVTAAAQSADLFVTKTAPATASINTNITFTITLGNGGPDDAAAATFNDPLPADVTFVSYTQTTGPTFACTTPSAGSTGTVNCSIATLTAGDVAQFDIVVNVSPSAAGTTLINSVVASSQTPDDTDENNTSITGTSVAGGNSADVSIVKTGPSSAPANSDVAYTITVTNAGPNDAGHVQWTDTLPTGVPASPAMTFVSFTQNSGPTFNCGVPAATTTCSLDPMPNGTTATFTLTGHIPSGTASGKTFTNVASVTSDNDPNPDNDSGATTLTVSSVDVGVAKSGPLTAVAGGPTFDYVITLSNAGPDPAEDASFNDNLPAGIKFVALVQDTGPAAICNTPAPNTTGNVACTISLLPNGVSAQFTVTVQAAPTVANGTIVSNTATSSTSSADSNPSNDSSTAMTTVSANADVSVTKSAPAAAVAGSNITYTITIQNLGPSDAASVTLTDVLPAGTTFVSESQTNGPTFTCTTGATVTCSIASFAANASATFNVTVTLSGSLTNGTTVTNTASASSATPDSNLNNNTSSAPTLVSASADLSVTKSGPAATPSNTNVTYTVIAANAGPSNAASVTLTETVPAGMTFVSANQTTGPPFSCSGTGPIVCTIASFASGASATFQFTFNVPLGTPAGTSTSNTVTIGSTTPDPTPSNNTASVTTTVGASIPTLSPLAMALLAMALAAVGWMIAKRTV
jgi:large repetitive protein